MKNFKRIILSVVALCFLLTLAACNKGESEVESIKEAGDFVAGMYAKYEGQVVKENFELITFVKREDESFNVKWEIAIAEGGDETAAKLGEVNAAEKTQEVIINTKATKDTDFVLKLTVTYQDDKKEEVYTKELNLKVLKYAVNTWAEYKAAKKDTNLVVVGVVTGKTLVHSQYKNLNVYLQDKDGGYLAYRVGGKDMTQAKADKDFAIGNTIEVKGVAALYHGLTEINVQKGSYTVVSTEAKTVATVDATADLKAGTDLEKLQVKKIKVVGAKVVSFSKESNDYGVVTFGFEGSDKQYTMTLLQDTRGAFPKEDQEDLLAKLKVGYEFTVEGWGYWANEKFDLIPFNKDAVTVTSVEVTDEVKAKAEADDIATKVPAQLHPTTYTIALPEKGLTETDATVAYEVTGTNIAITDKKLVITPQDAAAKGTLKITVTLNGKTAETTVEVNTPKKGIEFTDYADTTKFTDKQKMYVKGTVTAYKDTKFTIKDAADKTIKTYKTNDLYGAKLSTMKPQPKVGDEVVIYGTWKKQYKNLSDTVLISLTEPTLTDEEKASAEALAIYSLLEKIVWHPVTMKINLPLKGTIYPDATVSYEKVTGANLKLETLSDKVLLTVTPQATATVCAVKIKVSLNGKERSTQFSIHVPSTEITFTDYSDTTKFTDKQKMYVKGTVTAYKDTKFTIKDAADNTIKTYKTNDINGATLSTMTPQPKVGDEVVIYGDWSTKFKNLSHTVLISIKPSA